MTTERFNRALKQKEFHIFRNPLDIAVGAGLALLFSYFFLFCEVRELGDSFQYLNQFPSREPVYALLLQALSAIFGRYDRMALSLIQNGLAVIAIYWLYHRITSLFSLNVLFRTATALLLTAPHIITPFAARTGMIITTSILTEGIALSLYDIWVGMMLTFLLGQYPDMEKRIVRLSVWTLVFSLFLSMIRGQLMICILVWGIVTAFCVCREKKYVRLIFVVAGVALCFAGKTQLTKIYNYLESGLYVDTVSSKPMMLSNLVYLSGQEAGIGIEDEKLKQTYEEIILEVERQNLSILNAGGNILQKAQFHEYGHETINFDIIVPHLNSYILEKDGIDESTYYELLVKQDQYAGKIFTAVIPNVIKDYLKNYFVIASLGFVRSIAIDRFILPYAAFLLYILAMIFIGILLYRNHVSPSAFFMLFVLLLICGTVFGTSIMIECISRYMIYNFPLFYIAGMTMITEFMGQRKRKGSR